MYYPKTIVANDFSSLPFLGQGICYDGAKIRLSERLDHNEKRGVKTAEII